jgi:hypothetical protein
MKPIWTGCGAVDDCFAVGSAPSDSWVTWRVLGCWRGDGAAGPAGCGKGSNGDARRRVAQMNVKTRNRREKDREI